MTKYRDPSRPPDRVREPVQVYLDPADQDRLERLRSQLNSSKSDVLRRGLEALERALFDPDHHPALRIIGLADGSPVAEDPGYDVAQEHDRYFSQTETESWGSPGEKGRRGR